MRLAGLPIILLVSVWLFSVNHKDFFEFNLKAVHVSFASQYGSLTIPSPLARAYSSDRIVAYYGLFIGDLEKKECFPPAIEVRPEYREYHGYHPRQFWFAWWFILAIYTAVWMGATVWRRRRISMTR